MASNLYPRRVRWRPVRWPIPGPGRHTIKHLRSEGSRVRKEVGVWGDKRVRCSLPIKSCEQARYVALPVLAQRTIEDCLIQGRDQIGAISRPHDLTDIPSPYDLADFRQVAGDYGQACRQIFEQLVG